MRELMVELREWERRLPEKGSELYQRFLDDEPARQTAAFLSEKGILEITELKDGLKLAATSFVGKVRIGSIQIGVRPKLEGMPLYRLLRYAYGLKDLELLPEARHRIDDSPLHDILIYQLCAEAEELLARGLSRGYVRIAGELESPRGRIDIKRLLNKAGAASATLPCIYFERIEDNLLNRVLLAGLHLGLELTSDLRLKNKLHRLCRSMQEAVTVIGLSGDVLQRAWRNLNRLTENYRAALEIIGLLYDSRGIQLEDGSRHVRLQGFFFDMNRFFQALLSRLLHDFLEGYEVRDEYSLHGMFAYTPGFNPRRRRPPTPRPDFAVFKGNGVICLLDAKYRDLWENPLPREMLYQLAVYAVSGRGGLFSKILYPAIDAGARVQKIDLLDAATGVRCAQIVLQPVLLLKLADLLAGSGNRKECSRYLRSLVFED